jgi:hypothetical protein
MELD